MCLANWGDGQEDASSQPFAQGGCLHWQYALFVHSERRPVGRPEELLVAFVERAGLGRPWASRAEQPPADRAFLPHEGVQGIPLEKVLLQASRGHL